MGTGYFKASGAPDYDRSVAYVRSRLEEKDLMVGEQSFN